MAFRRLFMFSFLSQAQMQPAGVELSKNISASKMEFLKKYKL